MTKLIRDLDPTRPWKLEELKQLIRPVRSRAEHHRLLRKKILEEVAELLDATNDDEMVDEACDSLQAIIDYLAVSGVRASLPRIINRLTVKAIERGDFAGGTVLDLSAKP